MGEQRRQQLSDNPASLVYSWIRHCLVNTTRALYWEPMLERDVHTSLQLLLDRLSTKEIGLNCRDLAVFKPWVPCFLGFVAYVFLGRIIAAVLMTLHADMLPKSVA